MESLKEMREWVMDMWAAYHEAGHAVAAMKIKGLRAVGAITIDEIKHEQSNHGGFHNRNLLRDIHPASPSLRARIRVEKEIMVALAGGLAEGRRNESRHLDEHSSSDQDYAAKLALYANNVDESAGEAFLRWLVIRADIIVESYWPTVEALAQELLKRRRMTGKELREWFDQWFRNGANAGRLRRWQDKMSREREIEGRDLAKAAREKKNGHRGSLASMLT